jgi:hypothetical protein
LRGATKCLRCNREHEPMSASFGIYGSVSICPGHPVNLKRSPLKRMKCDGEPPPTVADEIIGRAQVK